MGFGLPCQRVPAAKMRGSAHSDFLRDVGAVTQGVYFHAVPSSGVAGSGGNRRVAPVIRLH